MAIVHHLLNVASRLGPFMDHDRHRRCLEAVEAEQRQEPIRLHHPPLAIRPERPRQVWLVAVLAPLDEEDLVARLIAEDDEVGRVDARQERRQATLGCRDRSREGGAGNLSIDRRLLFLGRGEAVGIAGNLAVPDGDGRDDVLVAVVVRLLDDVASKIFLDGTDAGDVGSQRRRVGIGTRHNHSSPFSSSNTCGLARRTQRA